MTRAGVSISVAAIRSGVKVPTIRYREEIGHTWRARRAGTALDGITALTTSAGSSPSSRTCQLGFEIDAIRALLTIQDNLVQSCEAVDDIARASFSRWNGGSRTC
jgi:DNA-binding transcriptional MerR regulator